MRRAIQNIAAAAGVAALSVIAGVVLRAQNPAAANQPASRTARQVIDAAAAALGGADRVRALTNVTLIGYGQYAYQRP